MAIQSSPDAGLRELALFAGAGGGILGGKILGWRTICAVERDAYAAQVLSQRQDDGHLETFPIWSDVTSFDGKPWRGRVDVVTGGFPCQDISAAGKGAGLDGDRSGLWSEMARIIGEVQPRYAFIENSPMLVTRGLDRVLCDLAAMGFDVRWGVVSAADTGAPHKRDRIWIKAEQLANTPCQRCGEAGQNRPQQPPQRSSCCGFEIPDTNCQGCQGEPKPSRLSTQIPALRNSSQGGIFGCWPTEPQLGRVADGVANRVDRLKAIGNGQVPRVAASAWHLLGGEVI